MFSSSQTMNAAKRMTGEWSSVNSKSAQIIVCSQFYTGGLAVS
jgi:hypothetical protein